MLSLFASNSSQQFLNNRFTDREAGCLVNLMPYTKEEAKMLIPSLGKLEGRDMPEEEWDKAMGMTKEDLRKEMAAAGTTPEQIAEMQADYHKNGVAKHWFAVIGAAWDKPYGQGSSLMGKLDHPVVHISYNDAAAYCKWAGRRLPTEMEWELASKGDLNKTSTAFPWGNSPTPAGKPTVNVAGEEDGFKTTAPVKSFQPNSAGISNAVGNVWEWVNETFAENKAGPTKHVLKGGSYVSSLSRDGLNNANLAGRAGLALDSGYADVGFRCAGSPKSLVDSVIDSVSGWFGN